MSIVSVVTHPLLDGCLARLRDERTGPAEFRRALREATLLLVCESTQDFELKSMSVRTPVTTTRVRVLKRPVLLVPILRAGLGMLDAALELLPEAQVGMIGLKRDEDTLQPSTYKSSLPANLSAHEIMVMDPMLATGGSAIAALRELFSRGARRVRLLHLLASPEGVKQVGMEFPDVPLVIGAMDRRLNRQGYIVPGLGDAGDRLYGV